MRVLIRGGLLVDPVRGERRGDLLLSGGRIARAGGKIAPPRGCEVVEAEGLWVFPGLIDLHVHAREPGGEAAETLASCAAGCAAGGVTTALLMPNTNPPLDNPALLRRLRRKAAKLPANLLFSAAATAGRAGEKIADLAGLKRAGAAAFTDDGSAFPRALVPELARRAARLRLPLLDHPEDLSITGAGVIHAGAAARRLGVPGIPAEAELAAVRADIAASVYGPVHLQHLSLASTVEALREAKRRGLPVTGETCPHYFTLSDRDIRRDDANFKMKPPLRGAADRAAVLRGLADGTIDAVATDHAPHAARLKAKGLRAAPFGVMGLETLAPLCVTQLGLPPRRLAALLCLNPARILGLRRKARLLPGYDADITVLDPADVRPVPAKFASPSSNSPFIGRRLRGWPAATFARGVKVFSREPAC